jgi:DNA polymerase III sliding clamp (beta) subunit (PCNA family)
MKVNRQELASALALACKVARKPTKRGSSNLENVRLCARDGHLYVGSTDYHTFIEIELEAPSTDKWDTLVPCHALAKFVKEGSSRKTEMVELELGIGGFNVTTENGNLCKFAELPSSLLEWIPWATKEVYRYDASQLRAALRFVMPAVSTDDTRPHICRVAFLGHRIATTDGHRMHVATVPSLGPDEITIQPQAAWLVCDVCKVPGQAVLGVNQDSAKAGWATFTIHNATITTKLIELDFPPIDQVMIAVMRQYVVNTRALSQALKSAAADNVRLTCNDTIMVEVDNHDTQSRCAVSPRKAPNDDNTIVIGVNRQYLLDALNVDDDEINFQVTSNMDPFRIDHRGGIAIVMPMRI